MYSKEIARAIQGYFKLLNMDCYEFNEENGIFTYDFIPNSKIKRMHCTVFVEEKSFRSISTLELAITEECVEAIASCLNKINRNTTSAHFVFDKNKKEIYCQSYTKCSTIPTNDIIAEGLFGAMTLVQRYGDIIFDIIDGTLDHEQLNKLLEAYKDKNSLEVGE